MYCQELFIIELNKLKSDPLILQDMLEKIIEKMKEPAVNAMATFTLVTPILGSYELWYGKAPFEVLKIRTAASIWHLMKGHLFQKGRELWSYRFGVTKESSAKAKYFSDTVYSSGFHLACYYGILRLTGSDYETAMKMCTIAVPINLFISAIHGRWNDWFRSKLGYEPTLHE